MRIRLRCAALLTGVLLCFTGCSGKPLDQMSTEEKLQYAQQFFSEHKSSEAIDLYLSILQEDPNQNDARVQLARLYHSLGRSEDAQEMYEQAAKLDPGSLNLITEWLAVSQKSGAIEQVEQAAELLYDAKDYDLSVTAYEVLLSLAPDRRDAMLGLARALRGDGRHSEALHAYRNALTVDKPEDATNAEPAAAANAGTAGATGTPSATGATSSPVATGATASPEATGSPEATSTPLDTGVLSATATPIATGTTATPETTAATSTPEATSTPQGANVLSATATPATTSATPTPETTPTTNPAGATPASTEPNATPTGLLPEISAAQTASATPPQTLQPAATPSGNTEGASITATPPLEAKIQNEALLEWFAFALEQKSEDDSILALRALQGQALTTQERGQYLSLLQRYSEELLEKKDGRCVEVADTRMQALCGDSRIQAQAWRDQCAKAGLPQTLIARWDFVLTALSGDPDAIELALADSQSIGEMLANNDVKRVYGGDTGTAVILYTEKDKKQARIYFGGIATGLRDGAGTTVYANGDRLHANWKQDAAADGAYGYEYAHVTEDEYCPLRVECSLKDGFDDGDRRVYCVNGEILTYRVDMGVVVPLAEMPEQEYPLAIALLTDGRYFWAKSIPPRQTEARLFLD